MGVTSFEAETLILAGADTAWEVITDEGNYPVWNTGITEVSGRVQDGEHIRIRTSTVSAWVPVPACPN
jgi:hypothetical protein